MAAASGGEEHPEGFIDREECIDRQECIDREECVGVGGGTSPLAGPGSKGPKLIDGLSGLSLGRVPVSQSELAQGLGGAAGSLGASMGPGSELPRGEFREEELAAGKGGRGSRGSHGAQGTAGVGQTRALRSSAVGQAREGLHRRQVASAADVARAVARMAHEVLERNRGPAGIGVIGLQRGGVNFARRLAELLAQFGGEPVPWGSLDVSWYRDDIAIRPLLASGPTEVPFDVAGRVVVLADDVIFTGRTVRAALDALSDLGRPRAVQLAVLVDRGHRELPIRPDFVGKNLPSSLDEEVEATLEGIWILPRLERLAAREEEEEQ